MHFSNSVSKNMNIRIIYTISFIGTITSWNYTKNYSLSASGEILYSQEAVYTRHEWASTDGPNRLQSVATQSCFTSWFIFGFHLPVLFICILIILSLYIKNFPMYHFIFFHVNAVAEKYSNRRILFESTAFYYKSRKVNFIFSESRNNPETMISCIMWIRVFLR